MFTAVIVAVLVIPSGQMQLTAHFGPFASERTCRSFVVTHARQIKMRGFDVRHVSCVEGQRL